MILQCFVRSVALLTLAAGSAAAQATPPPGPSANTKAGRARALRGTCDDRWLGQALLAELHQAAAAGEYTDLTVRTGEAILARLTCGGLNDLTALNDLTYVLRACKYLPLAERTSGGKEFAQWLLAHRPVARRMFRAVGGRYRPEKSLEALQQLQAADEQAVVAYPDLAVAFATAQPARHYRKQTSPATMLESFRWYTRSNVRFRYDLKAMPYELSRFLANSRLPLPERQWAVNAYRRYAEPAKSYFDLQYDYDYYRKGKPKKISKLPYTLGNLRKVGGVCIDQAYYASEVCRALGIPAAIVVGEGSSGVGHAWVACLKIERGGRSATWDTHTGRYQAHQYYSGDVTDPAMGRMHDSELMLVGAAVQLPLIRREQADTAVLLARMADKAHRNGIGVDVSVLSRLAADYDKAHADEQGSPKAATDWIQAARKIDGDLVEDLVFLAIQRNLAYRPAWELIIELRKADRLPADQLDRFFEVLVKRTTKAYPEYSCRMVMRIVPTLSDPARREAVYKRSLGVYGWRPDLQGKLLIALGDDYRKRDEKDKALSAYGQAAEKSINVPETVLRATRRAEELLVEGGRKDMAISMYSKLFAQTRARNIAGVFQQQTSHYQLGSRLAVLLEQEGRAAEAQKIRAGLGGGASR